MEKLLNIAMLGNMLTRSFVFQRFLPGVAGIILLTNVAAILGGALLTAAFYGLYIILTHHMDPEIAAIVALGLTFLTAVMFIGLAVLQLQKLRKFSFISPASDLAGISQMVPSLLQVGNVVDAFVDGFRAPRTKVPARHY